MDSAPLSCFAARRVAREWRALAKRRNAAAGHERGARRVGLSAPLAALRLAYVAVLHGARRASALASCVALTRPSMDALPGTLTGQLNPSISPCQSTSQTKRNSVDKCQPNFRHCKELSSERCVYAAFRGRWFVSLSPVNSIAKRCITERCENSADRRRSAAREYAR